jgi:hypothetical protein
MRSRGPAAGQPESTYLRHSQLCYQHIQRGTGGWKAPRHLLRMEALSSAIDKWLERPNLPTVDDLSSAMNMCSRGPAAVKPEPTYVEYPQLCYQYIQTGPAAEKPQGTYTGWRP